jgi:RNA polymerase sigma-70 factor, ECF subfamily
MNSGIVAVGVGSRVETQLTIRDCRVVTPRVAPESGGDAALVLAAREGDRTAFGALYARYARMVHGILLAKVPATDIDDLVQDVFLKALPRLRDLRDATRFGPWIAAITRNRANDYYRQMRPAAEMTKSLSDEDSEEPAAQDAPTAEAAMILEIVRSLPEAYRETMILRLVEGMTGPEIAERTGLKAGSVRVNLHRGMQQLREKLAQASPSTRDSMVADISRGSAGAQGKDAMRKRNEP